MLFNSLPFFVFLPIVALLYFIIPLKLKTYWLLAASYFFYMCWSPEYALLLFTSTLITYIAGLCIEKFSKPQHKNWVIAISCILNLSILGFFKYFDFALKNINIALGALNLSALAPTFQIILPVGISFYMFQAIGYTIDVYRGTVCAERNFARYALFVSFFPLLLSGPIERSGNMLPQFKKHNKFDYDTTKKGLLTMLWGFFVKLVIADRAAVLVNTVYSQYQDRSGSALFVATLLFAVQIYCDFYSYSEIARGTAMVMGFKVLRNFNAPYATKSIAEFWRRWHIALSSWFKDYLYIPLGGNRVSKWKRYRNIMIVFIVSGLWHGAQWSYVMWGFLHGAYQVIGHLTKSGRDWLKQRLCLKTDTFSYKLWQTLCTFLLVDFAWIFFRAPSFTAALEITGKIFTDFDFGLFVQENIYKLGLSQPDMTILFLGIAVFFIIDHLRSRICISQFLAQQGMLFRWLVYFAMLFVTLIYGCYGSGYDASQFIYFQF